MKWKSVKDGLPTEDTYVWACNEKLPAPFAGNYYSDSGEFISRDEIGYPLKVTHYIELPNSIKGALVLEERKKTMEGLSKVLKDLKSMAYSEEKDCEEVSTEKPKRGRPKGSGKKRGRKKKETPRQEIVLPLEEKPVEPKKRGRKPKVQDAT